MKRSIVWLKGLVALIIFCSLSACATAEKDWQRTVQAKDPEVFQQFTRKYPNSELATEASRRIRVLAYEEAQRRDNPGAYEEYLQNYPNNEFATDVRKRISKLDWTEAQKANTLEAYGYYLCRHPNGEFAGQAKEIMTSRLKQAATSDWRIAERSNNFDAYVEFIRKHPDSEFADKVKTNIKDAVLVVDAEWQETQRNHNDINGYKEFLRRILENGFLQSDKDKAEILKINKQLELLEKRKIKVKTTVNVGLTFVTPGEDQPSIGQEQKDAIVHRELRDIIKYALRRTGSETVDSDEFDVTVIASYSEQAFITMNKATPTFQLILEISDREHTIKKANIELELESATSGKLLPIQASREKIKRLLEETFLEKDSIERFITNKKRPLEYFSKREIHLFKCKKEAPTMGIAISRRKIFERGALLIQEVQEGSNAALAGIRSGDIILEYAGKEIRDEAALPIPGDFGDWFKKSFKKREIGAKEEIKIKVLRDGKEIMVNILGELSGITYSERIKKIEIGVDRVLVGGPADLAGIRPGDILLEFDGKVPKDSYFLNADVGKEVEIKVLRDGMERVLSATIQGEGRDSIFELRISPAEKSTSPIVRILRDEESSMRFLKEHVWSLPFVVDHGFFKSDPVISESQEKRRPFLGFIIRRDTITGAVVVVDVIPGSPGGRGGARRGDVIVEFDRKTIKTLQDLPGWAAALRPDLTVAEVVVMRDGEMKRLVLPIWEEKEGKHIEGKGIEASLGFFVQDLTPELARKLRIKNTTGVVVTDVESNSAAEGVGLELGDMIIEVNRVKVASVSQFQKGLKRVRPDEPILLLVKRNDSSRYVLISDDR